MEQNERVQSNELDKTNELNKTSDTVKIKICGLTKPAEAAFLNEIHADFAGMVVFFPKSKRNISLEQAKKIKQQLLPEIKTVAVTVAPTLEQIRQIADAEFDLIQIHKSPAELTEKTVEAVSAFAKSLSLPILKAFNVSDIEDYALWRDCPAVAGFVFDAAEPGSGKVFDWTLLQSLPRNEKLFMLAGGLTPENVSDAVHFLHPDGVDVSSGVEYIEKNRSGKDPDRIRAFAKAVQKDEKNLLLKRICY